MAFQLRYKADFVWVPDGAGGMSVANAQVLTFIESGYPVLLQVPGGDAPSQANLQTAATNMGADLSAQITAAVAARIAAFATGGG